MSNITKAYINSHSDYRTIHLTNNKGLNETWEEHQWEPEEVKDIDPGKYQMIYWNDDGPENLSYNDKVDYVMDTVKGFWGEERIMMSLGYEEWDDEVLHEVLAKNVDKVFDLLLAHISTSYPDKDSGYGVVLLEDNSLIANGGGYEIEI